MFSEPPSYSTPPATVSLPANRSATLFCQGPTSANAYTPLTFSWEDEDGQQLNATEQELELSEETKGLSYLRRTTADGAGLMRYSCVAGRTVRSQEVKIGAITTITIVGEDSRVLLASVTLQF